MVSAAPTRPVLRYLGGKWKLAPWIIAQFPPHRVYVEPFGGAASVLLRKPRSAGECYNDLDRSLVTLFHVLRDPIHCEELRRRLSLTPFARDEYDLAFVPSGDPIELARRLIVRSFMGHGSSSAVAERPTGFRAALVNRGGALPAGDWRGVPAAIAAAGDRLMGVLIENRPAMQVIDRYDESDCLFYVDPPYVPDTRSAKRKGGRAFHGYGHEMSVADHEVLLDRLVVAKGMVILSGYSSELYDRRLPGWKRLSRSTHTHGAIRRTEELWLNPAVVEKLGASHAVRREAVDG